MTNLTFASVLMPEGVVAAAALVTSFIALLRYSFPGLAERVSGAMLAFILTAILYVFAGIATSVATLDGALAVFIAWVSCATSSVGIHSTAQHVLNQRGPSDAVDAP